MVFEVDTEHGRQAIVDLVGRRAADPDTGQVPLAQNSGDRHKTQQGRDNQVDQVVAGINGGEAKQQGDDDIENPGPGQGQAKGTGISSSSDCNNSLRSIVSFSGRIISR